MLRNVVDSDRSFNHRNHMEQAVYVIMRDCNYYIARTQQLTDEFYGIKGSGRGMGDGDFRTLAELEQEFHQAINEISRYMEKLRIVKFKYTACLKGNSKDGSMLGQVDFSHTLSHIDDLMAKLETFSM